MSIASVTATERQQIDAASKYLAQEQEGDPATTAHDMKAPWALTYWKKRPYRRISLSTRPCSSCHDLVSPRAFNSQVANPNIRGRLGLLPLRAQRSPVPPTAFEDPLIRRAAVTSQRVMGVVAVRVRYWRMTRSGSPALPARAANARAGARAPAFGPG